MIGSLIVIGLGLTALSIIFIIGKIKNRSIRKEYSDWQVGDHVMLYTGGDTLYKVLGWEPSGFYIEKEGSANKIDWDKLDFNKSAIWRRNHQACEATMGTAPGFSPGLSSPINSQKIDGKSIDLLTEVECQVYLKQALESENYELAEKIKKQMEKYR